MLRPPFTSRTFYRAKMFSIDLRLPLCLATSLLVCFNSPALALRMESRIPLGGCKGHFSASGSARHLTIRHEERTDDHEETIIDIKHVPLPPGTVLTVFITDEPVGTITLDKKQAGSLKLRSSFKKSVPPIGPGSKVYIKTSKGRLVMW